MFSTDGSHEKLLICTSEKALPSVIPHICHLNHLYIGGEKIGHVKNFRFQYTTDVEKSEILPDLEEFQNSTHDKCEEI